jgi:hypothetical protein
MLKNLHNNSESIPLVLVNIGPIPEYLKSNLKYLEETFCDRRKVLICNTTDDSWLNGLSFDLVNSDSLVMEWPQQFIVSDNRQYFRNNFWFTSKARLLLLTNFMKIAGMKRVLHVENDVWLNPKFPFQYFDELEAPLAFPRVDNERGIASTLFIHGEEGINLLEQACDKWSTSTDMEILGNIMNSDPRVCELSSTRNIGQLARNDWLFDGAKLGMYLFGTDPRNSKGIIKRFRRSPLGELDPCQKIDHLDRQIVLQTKDSEFKIASLHIHSKDKRIFGKNWEKILTKQLRKERLRMSLGFSRKAFWIAILEVFSRGKRKLKSLR